MQLFKLFLLSLIGSRAWARTLAQAQDGGDGTGAVDGVGDAGTDGFAGDEGEDDSSLLWLDNYADYYDQGYEQEAYDMNYYDTYNYYDDYYYEEFDTFNPTECAEDVNGQFTVFTGTACEVEVKGGDKVLDKLKGGIDGLYKSQGCYEGKPYYKRDGKDGPFLYYTPLAGAWDFAPTLDEPLDSTVLVYSESDFGFISDRPQLVSSGQWFLSTDYMKKPKNADAAFESHPSFTVQCKAGSSDSVGVKAADVRDEAFIAGPLLTDAEMDSQFMEVYKNNAESGTAFKVVTVLMLVAIALFGLSMTLGVPCLLYFKRIEATRSLVEYVEHQRKQATGRLD